MTPEDQNKLFQMLGEIKEATYSTKKGLADHIKDDENGNRVRDRIIWMGMGGLAILQIIISFKK